MLSITRNIVNDRNSNRVDNVIEILGVEVAERLRLCLHQLRGLLHQQCFDVLALELGSDPSGWGRGFKRDALKTAKPATMPSTPTWRYWLAAHSSRLGSSSASHRVVNCAE
jgi:hypothetical protein